MLNQEDTKEMFIPCKAKIENFPSRSELLQLLDELISNNRYRKDYYCDNRDNCIIISFKNSNIAFEFMKVISIHKAKNAIYSKIKTSLIFDDKTGKTKGGNANIKSRVAINQLNNSKELNPLMTEPNDSIMPRLKKNGYVLTKRSPLLISDPYIEPKRIAYAEYAMNKSKWIHPNGFNKYVNTEKNEILGEIGTYVTRSQADYTYKNYRLRDVNKRKWISNKNFEIKHLPYYI